MNEAETTAVAGGNPRPGQSWGDYLQERFPDGVWVGSSFFPNGIPTGGETPSPEL